MDNKHNKLFKVEDWNVKLLKESNRLKNLLKYNFTMKLNDSLLNAQYSMCTAIPIVCVMCKCSILLSRRMCVIMSA